MATSEKIKQKLGFASGFKPTVNDRTLNMYRELTMHAKLIKGLQGQVKKLHHATDGMLNMVLKAYTQELPHDYSVETKTEVATRSAPVARELGVDQEAKRGEIDGIRALLGTRLEEEVFVPSNQWLSEVAAAKADIKGLERTRLALDAQRRKYYKAEYKKVKNERNLGSNSASFTERLGSEGINLESAKKTFDEEEGQVYLKLRDLVLRSGVIFDCMEKAFAVGNDVMNKAQSCGPPAPKASVPVEGKRDEEAPAVHVADVAAAEVPAAVSDYPVPVQTAVV